MKYFKILKTKKWLKSGFTLLFATLVASLLLSIGLSILDITLQNFILSSTGRESQYAFYAADSGLECALYWDRNYPAGDGTYKSAFGVPQNDPNRSSNQPVNIGSASDATFKCNDKTIILNDPSATPLSNTIPPITEESNGAYATSTYFFNIDMSNSADKTTECFNVEVKKAGHVTSSGNSDPDNFVPPTVVTHTYIRSRGYNTCNTSNLRRLERGIEVDF